MRDLQHTLVRANGIYFHVAQIENDAPLVLFLHGFPEGWFAWRSQLAAVAQAGWRAWAPDLRGFNLSAKPRGVEAYHLDVLALDVLELLNAARADKAILVGHDWGGLIAWRFAMDHPEHVSKLVIINAPHPARQRAGFFMPQQWLKSWYIAAFQIPYVPETVMAKNARAMAEGIKATAVRHEAFGEAELDAYARAIAEPGAMGAAINYYRSLARGGIWLPVKPIDAPTLMVWGEDDIALSKDLTYGTERWVRDFRIHYIRRCGHWVPIEAAAEVNEVLINFLK